MELVQLSEGAKQVGSDYQFKEEIIMKYSMRKMISSIAFTSAIAMTAATGSVMAFVDKGHSAEGVKKSGSIYSGSGSKPSRFVDYDHTPEGIKGKSSGPQDWKSAGNCGFLNCDHTAQGRKS
jgi:hypothetical protein